MQLKKEFIDVWKVHFSDLNRHIPSYRKLLSEGELQKASKFLFEEHRHSFILTKAVQRILIANYLDLDPKEIEYTINPFGKPSIKNNPSLHFNLSHSHAILLVAFQIDEEIGVDIEKISKPSFEDIPSDVILSEEEQRHFLSLSEEQRIRFFFEIWTRKESIVKCIGCGLSRDLKSISAYGGNAIHTRSFFLGNYAFALSTSNFKPILFQNFKNKLNF